MPDLPTCALLGKHSKLWHVTSVAREHTDAHWQQFGLPAALSCVCHVGSRLQPPQPHIACSSRSENLQVPDSARWPTQRSWRTPSTVLRPPGSPARSQRQCYKAEQMIKVARSTHSSARQRQTAPCPPCCSPPSKKQPTPPQERTRGRACCRAAWKLRWLERQRQSSTAASTSQTEGRTRGNRSRG